MELSVDAQEAVGFLADCVRVNTANPPGDEARLADLLARHLRAADVAADVQPVAPGRANLLARLQGSGERPTLVLSGHTDTVPSGEIAWEDDPWSGRVVNGRLCGLGAADMKAGLVAMVMAMILLRRAGGRLRGDLVLAATAGEEVDFIGARAVVDSGALTGAGAIIIGEPTDGEVAVAHKGGVRLAVTTSGRTAHSATPERGVNAIVRMHEVIGRLRTVRFPAQVHSQLGTSTLSINTIRGGTASNVVPDRCQIDVDIRTVPGLDRDSVVESVRKAVGHLGFPVDVTVVGSSPAVETDPDAPIIRVALDAAARTSGRPRRVTALPYVTDASVYQPALGVPVVICGPGEPGMAHQPNEWVAVSRYLEAIRFYAEVAQVYLA